MTYMSAVGPLARSAVDLRTALLATAGPENPTAKAFRWHLPPPRHTQLPDFRVGVVLDDDHSRSHARSPTSCRTSSTSLTVPASR
jgi:Asp-tRNA(Asn)/Glu-tRNA(Gln) amidotransferase A subunit family amidase